MSRQSQEIADEVQKEIEDIESKIHTSIKPSATAVCNKCGDEYCPGVPQCNHIKTMRK